MTILVTGSQGQLGSELCRQLGDTALGLGRTELDVTDRGAVLRVLNELRPAAIVNCAAYTQVDQAEDQSDLCWQINADAVGHLAEAAERLECPLVQISTDYVFGADGRRAVPYRETNTPGPLNAYGRSKLAGEQQARRVARHFVVRTCGLYGPPAAGRTAHNFVETILRLANERDRLRVVDDQRCTPTNAADVAAAILFLLGTRQFGTYHVTNTGDTTWHGFAAEIVRLAAKERSMDRITSLEFGARARRPSYSVLDTSKYHAMGGPPMRSWRDALKDYLDHRWLKRPRVPAN